MSWPRGVGRGARKKTVVDGIGFDSKKEAHRYGELKLMELAGEISNLRIQPKFTLQEKFKYKGKTIRAITYTADFRYLEVGKPGFTPTVVVEDVKGHQENVWKLKWKLAICQNPTIDWRVT